MSNSAREAIRVKRVFFINWKAYPNEANQHKLAQRTCKLTIRDAKKDFEACFTKSINTNVMDCTPKAGFIM